MLSRCETSSHYSRPCAADQKYLGREADSMGLSDVCSLKPAAARKMMDGIAVISPVLVRGGSSSTKARSVFENLSVDLILPFKRYFWTRGDLADPNPVQEAVGISLILCFIFPFVDFSLPHQQLYYNRSDCLSLGLPPFQPRIDRYPQDHPRAPRTLPLPGFPVPTSPRLASNPVTVPCLISNNSAVKVLGSLNQYLVGKSLPNQFATSARLAGAGKSPFRKKRARWPSDEGRSSWLLMTDP